MMYILCIVQICCHETNLGEVFCNTPCLYTSCIETNRMAFSRSESDISVWGKKMFKNPRTMLCGFVIILPLVPQFMKQPCGHGVKTVYQNDNSSIIFCWNFVHVVLWENLQFYKDIHSRSLWRWIVKVLRYFYFQSTLYGHVQMWSPCKIYF